jgi:hypothetical protein
MGARARAKGILHFVVVMVCCGEVTGECEPDSCSGTGGQLSATTAYLCCTVNTEDGVEPPSSAMNPTASLANRSWQSPFAARFARNNCTSGDFLHCR